MRYTLTARKGDRSDTTRLTCANDFDATFDAVMVILDRASSEDPDVADLWATGYITLTGADGTVLHTMDEKEVNT